MKVVIVSTFVVEGGAPIAAYRLHKGLREIGLESHMLVKINNSIEDPDIHAVNMSGLKSQAKEKAFFLLEKQINRLKRTELSNTYFSPPYPTLSLADLDLIRDADVINLHWVAKFLSAESISRILDLGKPVVWTLHDQNPFTGGCHYSAGCVRFREDCGGCPQLKPDRSELPRKVLKTKTGLWGDRLTVVTPSRWLGQSAGTSRVFRDCRIETIPNSLETEVFVPMDKAVAKAELGLNPQAFGLLLGAYTGFEKRKGYAELLSALRICLEDDRFREMNEAGLVEILSFGPPQDDLKEFFLEVKSFGYIEDQRRLAAVYSAADAFLLPSREDNLPNTMLEAMACGTPVLSFEVGGMPDMITNGETGYMARAFDSAAYGENILRLAFDPEGRRLMGHACRSRIEAKYRLADQARNYSELFTDLLQELPAGGAGIAAEPGGHEYEQEISLGSDPMNISREFSTFYREAAEDLEENGEAPKGVAAYLRRVSAKLRKRSGSSG